MRQEHSTGRRRDAFRSNSSVTSTNRDLHGGP